MRTVVLCVLIWQSSKADVGTMTATRAIISLWPQVSQRLSSKESACNAGNAEDVSSIPGLGRSPGGGNGNPL